MLLGLSAQNPENAHEYFRQPGFRQDGVMLLVVVNDKKPQQKQPRENAAKNFHRQIEIPKRSRNRQQQQPCCGKDAPPAPRRVVRRIRSRRQNELLARLFTSVKILCVSASQPLVHVKLGLELKMAAKASRFWLHLDCSRPDKKISSIKIALLRLGKFWSERRDSNPRHSRWQRDALPG